MVAGCPTEKDRQHEPQALDKATSRRLTPDPVFSGPHVARDWVTFLGHTRKVTRLIIRLIVISFRLEATCESRVKIFSVYPLSWEKTLKHRHS
jgi:hypothetical protein